MPYRIIYCALGCASILSDLQHETLRKLDTGIVAAVPDDVLGKLLSANSNTAMLFFSRSAYDRAIGGLRDREIENALRNRLTRWSPRILEDAVELVASGERRALALTARALKTANESATRILRAHFFETLDLLASFADEGGSDPAEIRDFLISAVESEAMLIAELGDSPESATRRTFAEELARELKRYGRAEFAEALPFAEPTRGVWVAPVDATLKRALRLRGEPLIDFRDGIVTSAPDRIVGSLPIPGKKTKILYFDAGQLLEDIGDLSQPELQRTLEKRFAADQSSLDRDRSDYLNTLRVEQAQLRRTLAKRTAKADRSLARLAERQFEQEMQLLVEHLSAAETWLMDEDAASPLSRLRSTEEQIASDAAVLSVLSRSRGDADMSRRLNQIIDIKRIHRSRLEAVPKGR